MYTAHQRQHCGPAGPKSCEEHGSERCEAHMTLTSRATVECAHLVRSDRPSSAGVISRCPSASEVRRGRRETIEWASSTQLLGAWLTFASPWRVRDRTPSAARSMASPLAGHAVGVRDDGWGTASRRPRQGGAGRQKAARRGCSPERRRGRPSITVKRSATSSPQRSSSSFTVALEMALTPQIYAQQPHAT